MQSQGVARIRSQPLELIAEIAEVPRCLIDKLRRCIGYARRIDDLAADDDTARLEVAVVIEATGSTTVISDDFPLIDNLTGKDAVRHKARATTNRDVGTDREYAG